MKNYLKMTPNFLIYFDISDLITSNIIIIIKFIIIIIIINLVLYN